MHTYGLKQFPIANRESHISTRHNVAIIRHYSSMRHAYNLHRKRDLDADETVCTIFNPFNLLNVPRLLRRYLIPGVNLTLLPLLVRGTGTQHQVTSCILEHILLHYKPLPLDQQTLHRWRQSHVVRGRIELHKRQSLLMLLIAGVSTTYVASL